METAASEVTRAFQAKAYGKPVFSGKFFLHPSLDAAKTAYYGINVYTSKLYIQIKTKGRKDNTTRLATDEDKEMFSEAWRIYQSNADLSGIPLQALPAWSQDNEATLNSVGVFTVEDLIAYGGDLPWHELVIMKHAAKYLHEGLLEYSPPPITENIDVKPRQKEVPVHGTMDAPRDREGVRSGSRERVTQRGEGSERIGVWLNEDGQIERTEGFQEEGRQEEGHPQKSQQQKNQEKRPLKLVF